MSYTPLNSIPRQGSGSGRPLRSGSGSGNALSSTPNINYHAIPIPQREPARTRSNMFLTPLSGNNEALASFKQSYQRAMSFRSLEPHLKASRSYFQDDEELIDPGTMAPSAMGKKISMLFKPSTNGEHDTSTFDEAAVDDQDESFLDQSYADYNISRGESMSSVMSGTPLARIMTADNESLFIRRVESRPGVKVTMVQPRSTVPQTVFNCINVLIGVGLLALSKAMTRAGWLFGGIMLVYSAAITYWTAGLLSKCMDTDPTLCTYADLGYKAYGPKARLYISLLFSVELLGVGVSLIVLFADSLNALIPQVSIIQFKLLGFVLLTPLSFFSLPVLSNISLLGITSTVSMVVLITCIGLAKPTYPGSLVDPAPTYVMPPSWSQLCISYGIILGPFGSHSLFPALKSDLATPQDFPKCLKTTYTVGFLADSIMAIIGFAMFGAQVMNEITKSVLTTEGYPAAVRVITSVLVSMIPIAKTPINAMPIINIVEYFCGITNQQLDYQKPTFWQAITRISIKLAVNGMFVLCAILYPEFDKIIGLSGASLCTLICIVLPCGFYVRICDPPNKMPYYIVMLFGLILGIISTYAAIVYD